MGRSWYCRPIICSPHHLVSIFQLHQRSPLPCSTALPLPLPYQWLLCCVSACLFPGSTHATPSMDPSSSRKPKSSEPDAAAAVTLQQQLGDATASDYVDPGYHKDINEYVAVHSRAAAAPKAKGKQKKTKGVKMAVEYFNELQVVSAKEWVAADCKAGCINSYNNSYIDWSRHKSLTPLREPNEAHAAQLTS